MSENVDLLSSVTEEKNANYKIKANWHLDLGEYYLFSLILFNSSLTDRLNLVHFVLLPLLVISVCIGI